jgi:hypothetical protein
VADAGYGGQSMEWQLGSSHDSERIVGSSAQQIKEKVASIIFLYFQQPRHPFVITSTSFHPSR